MRAEAVQQTQMFFTQNNASSTPSTVGDTVNTSQSSIVSQLKESSTMESSDSGSTDKIGHGKLDDSNKDSNKMAKNGISTTTSVSETGTVTPTTVTSNNNTSLCEDLKNM